jgi:glutathione S-transferase
LITLHHLNNSRSQRILWLMEELGLPYEIQRYQRDPKTMLAPPSLRAVHPLGKSPVITDGDLTLAESGAIIEYLVARYGAGRLAPEGRHAGPPALHLLDALRRRLGHAAAAAQAGLRQDRKLAHAVFRQTDCPGYRRQGQEDLYRAAAAPAPGLPGNVAGPERLVCRRQLQRR